MGLIDLELRYVHLRSILVDCGCFVIDVNGARGMQCMATHLAGVHVLLTQGVRAVLRKLNSEIIQKTTFWKLQMGPRVLIAAEEATKCQKGLS